MKKFISIAVAAGAMAATLPLSANAQEVQIVRERTRVCYDSDGDRVPCGRRYYRTYDSDRYYGDRYYYGGRYYRERPGVGVRVGPLGIDID